MATLPTVDVPDDELEAILTSFGGEDGFVVWLKTQAVERTLAHETQKERETVNRGISEKMTARRQELYADLGINTPGSQAPVPTPGPAAAASNP